MKRRLLAWLVGVLMAVSYLAPVPSARGADFDLGECRYTAGLRLAYGHNLSRGSVHLYSVLPRWGVILSPISGGWPGGLGLSFDLEGIVSLAEAQNNGFEIGLTPLLKLTLPLTRGLHLFLEGGIGIIGENFDNRAIAHIFNFTTQLGAGLEIALTPRLGLTLSYRARHSSNAGLYRENPAFNVEFFQAGLVYFY